MLLQSMTVEKQCPIVAGLMDSTVAKYITLSSNDYVYGGTAEDLIVNDIHPLFLKAG